MYRYRSSVQAPLDPPTPTPAPAPPTVQEVVRPPDWILAAAVAALTIFGLIMIYSTTYVWDDNNPAYFMLRQGAYAVVGIVALLVMMRIPYRFWQRISVAFMVAILVGLGVLLLVAKAKMGAARWFGDGSFQPSEVAKLAVIIYSAAWLASKGQKIRSVTVGLIPFSIFIGLVAGLILLQPNMSTASLIALTAFSMFLIAGADLVQMFVATLIGTLAAGVLILNAAYRLKRVAIFMDPLSDPDGLGYHITRALAALNAGGLVGLGLGNSPHKWNNMLPAPHTDSIFAMIGEELGFIGALAVVAVYVLIAYRGLRIAQRAPDRFGMLLASGITVLFTLQAMINIAVITSTAPFTGVPLPFISFGGSSLVISLATIGLLLNISRHVRVESTADASTTVGRRNRGTRVPRAERPIRPGAGD
ncbi:MAG: putative peptidoglycan glycosyltransferase FtsW [Anaerolineae bacterium]